MVEVGTWSSPVKVHQEKNRNQKKISTVFDRETKFPIDYRRIFLIAVFSWCTFTGKLLLANFINATVVPQQI
jgi:hypothetical protein